MKGIGWRLFSYDHDTHIKTGSTNPRTRWKWKLFEHKNIDVVGTVIGGTVEPDFISAAPTLGLYNAVMDVDFSVKYTYKCAVIIPKSTTLTYNSKRVFDAND